MLNQEMNQSLKHGAKKYYEEYLRAHPYQTIEDAKLATFNWCMGFLEVIGANKSEEYRKDCKKFVDTL